LYVSSSTFGTPPTLGKWPCATVTPSGTGLWGSTGHVTFTEKVISKQDGTGCFPPIQGVAWCLRADGTQYQTSISDYLYVYAVGDTHNYDDQPCAAEDGLRSYEITPVGNNAPAYYNGDALVNGIVWGEAPVPAVAAPSVAEQGGAPSWLESFTSCLLGDPVNCASGALVQSARDVNVPGRGLGLSWRRTYVSSLASTDGPLGFGWSFDAGAHLSIDGSGNATFVDGGGTPAVFTNTTGGSFSAPSRVRASLTGNTDGTYSLTQFPSHVVSVFSAQGVLLTMADRNGYTTTFGYDTSGHVATVSDSSGRALTVSWVGTHIVSVSDPMGRVTAYAYDGSGNLLSVTDPANRVTTYGYDSAHELTSVTDPRLGQTVNTYVGGQVTRQVDPAGLASTFAYTGDPASVIGSTTTMTDPHGAVSTRDYSQMLLQDVTTAVGAPQAATTAYSYDPVSLGRSMEIDPTGKVTRHTFSPDGDVTSGTDPLGLVTNFGYDSTDRVTSVTLPSGAKSTSSYTDAAGHDTANLQSSTDADGNVTTYAHADTTHPGDVTSVTDPDARVASMTYDPAGNLATSTTTPTAGVNNTAEYSYDADSELVCSVSPVKRAAGIHCPAPGITPPAGAQAVSYDPDGEVTASTDALGHASSFLYDLNGNRTDATDPRALDTKSTFDADNRALTVTAAYGTASARTTSAAYDILASTGACTGTVLGAVYCNTSTDAAGNATVNYYTATGVVAGFTRPGGLTTTYGYDLAGRMQTVTTPDFQVATTSYDDDGRPTSRSYSSGSPAAVSYFYNPDGHRTKMTDATGDSTYQFDPAGRLTQTTASGSTVLYFYDNAGHVKKITYPNNQSVTRGYDGAGRLTSITDWLGHLTTVAPDADGNPASTTYGNAVKATSPFDAVDQMSATTITNPTGTTLASLTYLRNENSQVASAAPTGLPGAAETYGYSALGQLNGVNTGTYTYNAVGSPTTLADGTTQAFNTANQLTSSTIAGAMTSYAYDGLGNQTAIVPPTGDKTNYAYDQAQHLTAVQRGKLYQPLTPARIADTDTGSGKPYAGQPIGPGGTLNVQATGMGGVPSTGVSAVVVNVAQITDTSATYLTVFQTGITRPATSNVNAVAGGADATNEVTVPVGTNGQISIYNQAGTTNVIVDVLGYYSAGGAGMNTITPTRIADTRTGSGQPYAGQPIPARGTLTVQVSGTAGIPTTATTAILEATVVTPTAGGYLTAYPAGITRPGISNLDYQVGVTLTKEIDADLGTSPSGAVTFYNSATVPVNLILDVAGYINSVGDSLTPLTSARIADTRTGSGQNDAGKTMAANTALTIQAAGQGGVPANARSVVVNMTVPGNTTTGYLTAYPSGTHPATTSVTYSPGAIAFNQVTVALSPTGSFTIWNAGGTADVVIDVMGSYGPLSSYTYNGDGLRASRTTTTGTQNFAWDLTGGVPLMLTDGAISYIYDDNGSPVEQIDAAENVLYYQHDQYGSTRLLTNSSGAIAASYTYNAYGALTGHTGTADTPLRWNGQYQDTDTGLYYLRTRYYNPTTAQFTTVDPATLYTGDPYNYATGDPLNNADPLGLFTCDATTRTGLMIGMNVVFTAGMLIPGWDAGPDEAVWAAYDTTDLAATAAETGPSWLSRLGSKLADDTGSLRIPGFGRGYTPSGAAADYGSDELAQFAFGHSGEGFADGAARPSLGQITDALNGGKVTPGAGSSSRVTLGNVRVVINEENPLRSTAYFLER
jgi:RHS repeat-associated protein